MVFIYLLFGLIALGYLYLKVKRAKTKNFWSDRNFATIQVKSSLWEFITEKRTLTDLDLMNYKISKNEKIAGYFELGNPVMFVYDFDLAKQIFIKDFDNFVNRRTLFKYEKTFNNMLFGAKDDKWKNMRTLLSPTFTTGKIKNMFEIFNGISQQLVDLIKREHLDKEIDPREFLTRYTIDIIVSAAFGVEVNSLKEKDSEFFKMGKKMQETSVLKILRIVIAATFPRVARILNFNVFDTEPLNFFSDIVKKSIKIREENGFRRNDFLQLLIDSKKGIVEDDEDQSEISSGNKKQLKLDDDLIIANAFLFFVAGFDTSEGLLVFATYHLATEQKWQERIFQEIKTNIAIHGENGQLTYDALNKLDILDRFISETLRLYPPATRVERVATNDFRLSDNRVIPKDTCLLYPLFAIQRDPEIYPNPDVFDPDRFLPEIKAERNAFAFSPFGQGRRNCIGQRFALVEAKTVIAQLVLNFNIKPSPEMEVPVRLTMQSFNLKPKSKVVVQLIPRDGNNEE